MNQRIEALFNAAYKHAQSLHKSPIVKDISKLWQALTINRSEGLSSYFKDPALRRAYLGYYMPLYAAKMAILIHQLMTEGHIAADMAPRVLDLGSGPLVGVTACRLAFGQFESALAIDREIGPMRQALDFLQALYGREKIYMVRANLAGPDNLWRPREPIDMAILSHVLNEFGSSRRELPSKIRLIKSAMATLSPQGKLLIMEPATRVSTRELMALRDEIHQDPYMHILAPCTGASQCPLLATRDGWCHGELKWGRPQICREIDEKIGFDKSKLKYSYLLLGRAPSQLSKDNYRVVSGQMHHENIARRYVCTASGLLTLSEPIKNGSAQISSYYRGQLVNLGKDI